MQRKSLRHFHWSYVIESTKTPESQYRGLVTMIQGPIRKLGRYGGHILPPRSTLYSRDYPIQIDLSLSQ